MWFELNLSWTLACFCFYYSILERMLLVLGITICCARALSVVGDDALWVSAGQRLCCGCGHACCIGWCRWAWESVWAGVWLLLCTVFAVHLCGSHATTRSKGVQGPITAVARRVWPLLGVSAHGS